MKSVSPSHAATPRPARSGPFAAMLAVLPRTGFALFGGAWLLAAPVLAGGADDRLIELDRASPDWLAEAKATVPSAWMPGRLYRLDKEALKAHVAVFPSGADDPETPGNPFDPGQVLVIDLERDGDRLNYAGSTMHTRSPNDGPESANEAAHALLLQELYGQAEAEPDFVPCRMRGWALSDSPAGTMVRADPSASAAILGRLAPPHRFPVSEAAPADGWRVEFDIVGYRNGWFRIANADAPGVPYGDPPPAGHPETYSGVGWIRTNEVGAAYANTRMPVGRLLQSPHIDALDFAPGAEASDPAGNLSIDNTLVRLHACSADWALTTSRDGIRGWWRGICSNQATNCS